MQDNTSTTTLKSADGLPLFSRNWQPDDTPTGAIAIVHGLGEHSERYDHVGRYFADKGYAVFAVDLRGHGRSEGQRGHVDCFDDYLDDVQALLSYAQAQSGDIPLFLLGHSMGGLISLTYALKHPDDIAAVLASGPVLKARVKVPAWKTTMGNLMSSIYPSLSMSNGIDPKHISRDKAVVDAYIADPLVHDQVTARWYTEFMNTGQWAMENANTLSLPALVLQGGDDPIVDPSGAKDFFDRISHSDKQHIEYPGLYHEILNEPEKYAVLNDMEAWLAPRL